MESVNSSKSSSPSTSAGSLTRFTKRVRDVRPSPTLALSARTKELQRSGVDIANFTAGEPDFDTPEHIKAAARDALAAGLTKYTPTPGTQALREAIAAKLARENGLTYKPSEIVVSCGAKHSLYNAILVLCEEGDEVLIPSPYWVSYPEMARLAEATPVSVETSATQDFKLSPEQLEAAITPRTRALILNSPSNPVGCVYTRKELAALAEVLAKHQMWVISDEIYDRITYDGVEAPSIAAVAPHLKDRVIVVNGVSKTYSMTGWRIGYAAGPAPVMKAIDSLQSHSTSNPTSISQQASVAALTGDQQCVRQMVEAFDARRQLLMDRLQRLGRAFIRPAGAFYLFCHVGDLRPSADEVAQWWLENAKVSVVPGEGFGHSQYVRFSFACSEETIEKGMDRLARIL